MSKLLIRVEIKTDLIEEAFNELESKNVFRTAQYKVFKAIYLSKVKSLYNILHFGLSKFIVTEGKEFFVVEEEGDDGYIFQKKEEFEKFILGSEEQLNKEMNYKKFKNDRVIIKIMRQLGRGIIKPKTWAIKKALQGGRVLDFLWRVGIMVTWKVYL